MHNTLNSLRLLHLTMEKIDGAYAPSTIRAYKGNFERFIEFCEKLKVCAIPADPEKVANYVSCLTKSGLKSSSIRIAVASISSIHKLNSFKDPTQHPDVKIEMRRMHRTLGRSSNQAFGITAELLEKMLSSTGNDLRGFRDRALLLVAYDSMCRRSELVSLRMEDIDSSNTGGTIKMKIRLRKSKTDQENNGKWLMLGCRSTESLSLWIEKAKINEGHLLRGVNNASKISNKLSCSHINRIYKRLATDAKFPSKLIKQISGHSMRIGAAQDLAKEGATLLALMHKGRWSKTDTVMRYIEAAELTYQN